MILHLTCSKIEYKISRLNSISNRRIFLVSCLFSRARARSAHTGRSKRSRTGSSGGSPPPPSPRWTWRANYEAFEASTTTRNDALIAITNGTASSLSRLSPSRSTSSSRRGRRRGRSQSYPRRQRALGKISQARHGNGHHQKRPVRLFKIYSLYNFLNLNQNRNLTNWCT